MGVKGIVTMIQQCQYASKACPHLRSVPTRQHGHAGRVYIAALAVDRRTGQTCHKGGLCHYLDTVRVALDCAFNMAQAADQTTSSSPRR